MKKAIVIVLLLGAAGGGGYWYWRSRGKPEQVAPPPTVKARRGNLTVKVSATGTVEPEYTVEIKSKASGTVKSVKVEEGDKVEKGALLVEIDPVVEQRRVTQARADLRMALAKRASVASKLAFTASQIKRDQALLKKGLVSREAFDLLRKESSVQRGELQVANAQILRARASYQEAKDRMAETKINAPIGGTIIERLVQPGQVIASGTNAMNGGTTLLKIADLRRLFVRVKVDEADVARVKAGQQVSVTADALPGKEFAGTVARVAPQGTVESNVTVFELVVEIGAEGRRLLRPMLTANVEIMVARVKGVVLLPRSAVRRRGARASVYLPAGGRKRVKVGLIGDKQIEIASGLDEGTEVLLTPPSRKRKRGAGRGGRKKGGPSAFKLRRVMGSGKR